MVHLAQSNRFLLSVLCFGFGPRFFPFNLSVVLDGKLGCIGADVQVPLAFGAYIVIHFLHVPCSKPIEPQQIAQPPKNKTSHNQAGAPSPSGDPMHISTYKSTLCALKKPPWSFFFARAASRLRAVMPRYRDDPVHFHSLTACAIYPSLSQ